MKKISSENRIDTRGSESARIEDIHLLIELTDYCNSKCIMCKQSKSENMHGNIPKQHMDTGLFIKIIEDIKNDGFKVTSIDPLWSGESMTHPDFKEMMYYLFAINKSHNLFNGFVLNTNAINMDEEVSDIFLDYAEYVQANSNKYFFMKILLSLDAARPDTYKKIRNISGQTLYRVRENISYLIKRRKESKLIVPNLIFGFIIMQENYKEAVEFRDYWKNILKDSGVPFEVVPTWPLSTDRDSIYYRQLICSEPEKAMALHKDVSLKLGLIKDFPFIPKRNKSIYKDKRTKSFRPPCGALWRTPNIASNGDVVPCCRDIDLAMVLGNVRNQSLYDVWYGDKITELRLAHIKGELTVTFEKFLTCTNCIEPEGGVLSDEEIYAYLKS
jgi:sulfatase maturation enzyme AslB (radical SAM superfamily)